MAYIDKMHGKQADWDSLSEWLTRNYKRGLVMLWPRPDEPDGEWTISSFDRRADVYLWKHCDVPFVVSQLKEQYGESGPRNYKGNLIVEYLKTQKI